MSFWEKALPAVPPKCGTCYYYDNGGCRRFPPGRALQPPPDGVGKGFDTTFWPIVRPDIDWCGEHKRS